MAQDLVGRVKRLLMSPKTEWDVIDQEAVEPQSLITGYVAPLAAIPAVAGFIGHSVFGMNILGTTYRTPFLSGLVMAIVTFALAIAGVFLFAYIINSLAPAFGAQKNYNQALKVSAYAPTAGWVAGIFTIIPILSILTLVGSLYSLYLIFVGLPKMMKPAADKATSYTVVSIVVAIVVYLIIGVVVNTFLPKPNYGAYGPNRSASSEMERRADAMEKAAESGDYNAMMGAAAGMMGGDPNAPVVDGDALKNLAPARVAGLDRQALSVESMNSPFKGAMMTADYVKDDKRMTVKVTNTHMLTAMTGLAGAMGAAYDRSSNDGYERLRREGDSIVIEEWSEGQKRGRYAKTMLGSFMVEAQGNNVAMRDLKSAVGDYSERELKNLPTVN